MKIAQNLASSRRRRAGFVILLWYFSYSALAQPPPDVTPVRMVGETNGQTLASLAVQVRNQGLALALFQLCVAIRTYRPFVRELNLVQQLGVGEGRLRGALDSLVPYASIGVATVAQLRDSFGIILLPKLDALAEESNGSWMGEAWSWFVATVIPVWQPARPSPTTSLMHTLVRSAMDRLSEDDLRGALDLITQLDDPGATLVARWLKEADARLQLDAAYEDLSGLALDLLTHNP